MKQRHRAAILGLVITVVLLWWVLRDVSMGEVWRRMVRADPFWLAAMTVTALASLVPRAWRWKVLLDPVHRETRFHPRFGAVCVGFMANNLLPARLGEFARAFALSRVEPVSMSAAFASLVVERMLDGLVLAAFLGLVLAVPGLVVAEGGAALMVRRIAAGAAVIFVTAMILLWLLARRPVTVVRAFEATVGRILPPDLGDRGTEALASFLEGLGALKSPWAFTRAVLWTVVVWAVAGLSIWMGLLAFDLPGPGILGAVFVQAVIAFAVAIPSSPGFFGPFEAGGRLALEVYGVDPVSAVSFVGTYHILTFAAMTLLGLWYARSLGLEWRELKESEEAVTAAVEAESAGLDAESPA